MRLLKVPGVYGPGSDSRLLARAITEHVRPGDRVLDVFTGSGVLAVTAALAGAAEVWAVDVSRRAVLGTALNARLNGVDVRIERGRIFEPIGNRRFDLIVANPPYVPSVDKGEEVRGRARAWEAGEDGRRFLDPFLEQLPMHLSPLGRALLVQSSLCDVDRTLASLAANGLDAAVAATEELPLGPITAPRALALEQRGLLARGQRTEETTVIAAFTPEPVAITAERAMVALSPA
ncbi:MAG: 50S ribosomal protein L11 methyltransferase [Actinomycetota bacterium]|nr:50S ribosomal protein L11 methyltransferase [Actinomycetota bacterium]